MSDDGGCAALISFAIICVLVGLGSCEGGVKSGRIEAKCSTHAEYTKTGADTLALVQKYPECAPLLFPEK